jgi:recombination protein RecT
VKAISAEVVYEADTFEVEQGTSPKLRHVPALKERGEIVACYAIAQMADGTTQFRVLTMDDVGKRKKASKAGRSGPWADWYDEMVRKTAVRALCKMLPQAPEAQRAAVVDEYIEAGHAPVTTAQVGYDALSVAQDEPPGDAADRVAREMLEYDREPGTEG